METRLYQKQSWYKPFYVDIAEKSYLLDNIIFYNDNGIIVEVGNGYFEREQGLTIKEEVVRKIKVDLTKKQNFIVKHKDKWYADDEVKYAIYIYADNVDLKYIGKEVSCDYLYDKYSVNGIEFTRYVEDLGKNLHSINEKAEQEVKKLADIFRYSGKGIEESELLSIFRNLQNYNREILNEVDMIKNYKV